MLAETRGRWEVLVSDLGWRLNDYNPETSWFILRYHRRRRWGINREEMMELVIILLILALIVAIFGFGGIPSVVTSAALTLFWIFLAVFIIAVIYRLINGRWWFSREQDKNTQIIIILGLAILAMVASIVVVFIRC